MTQVNSELGGDTKSFCLIHEVWICYEFSADLSCIVLENSKGRRSKAWVSSLRISVGQLFWVESASDEDTKLIKLHKS